MYIEGPPTSGKSALLIERFTELIYKGIPSYKILVLTSNSFKKKLFLEQVRKKLSESDFSGSGEFHIYTFQGVVYHTINSFWTLIEEKLNSKNKCSIIPDLCGLEATEYLLDLCIKKANREETLLNTFLDYYSGSNIKHQLLRRYRLIAENALTDAEVDQRANILNEEFRGAADGVLRLLKAKTLEARSFDYLKQTNTFLYLLNTTSETAEYFKRLDYLLADDVDEYSYAAQLFIKFLLPHLKDFYIAADPDGGARRGYLCAHPEGWGDIKDSFKGEILNLEAKNPIYKDALSIFNSIKSSSHDQAENIEFIEHSKRAEMFGGAFQKLKELLLDQEYSPEDIVVVSPLHDEALKADFKDFFKLNNLDYQFLSGTKKLIDNINIFCTLIIAQLVNEHWNAAPTEYEIRVLLGGLLNIPVYHCKEVLDYYKRRKKLKENPSFECEDYQKDYQNLINLVNDIKNTPAELYDQLYEIFTRLVITKIEDESEINDFNIMFKSLENFFWIIARLNEHERSAMPEKDWLLQIKNTVVTDNPPSAPDIKPNSVIIATPQRIIDLELRSKVQLWMDFSHNIWLKDDTGPLYNSWVFGRSWTGEEYTPDINRQLTLNKSAHILRKLVLNAEEKIYAFFSRYDSSGSENNNTLLKYIAPKLLSCSQDIAVIIPRNDQKPVMEYRGGKMAVPAVPGAGKTTIMRGLIIELVKNNVKPSQILVLTYMESAARLFNEKIRLACPGYGEYPHISTIHGLARRILRDEDNFTRLGLTPDFQICDDIQKLKIIREICINYLPVGEEANNKLYERNIKAVSKAKMSGITPEKLDQYLRNHSDQELEEFLPVYREYISAMKNKNLLDFDDLLLLATSLLKKHLDIRSYYQHQYRFILEDEAQDSSKIQQEMISLISEYHGNLIRCGDPNQAITSSFTSADVEGFRKFIAENNKVEMKSSQRCSKEIYELANYLIDWSKEQDEVKNAFLDIKMEPVEGKNPYVENGLGFKIFDNSLDERAWILSEIKKLKQLNPELTIGILVRTNPLVFEWSEYLEKNNIDYICLADSLKQKKIFSFILKFLEVLHNPWNNTHITQLYEEFIRANIYRDDDFSLSFLHSQGSPFLMLDTTEFQADNLLSFWWEINYWLEYAHLPAEELILKLGNYYFEGIIDKSNVHLLAALAKKFRNNFNNNEKRLSLIDLITYFKDLAGKNKLSFKLFSEDEEADNLLSGVVQVMTIHKAKGNEFDAVFVPEMYEKHSYERGFSYAVTHENIYINQEELLLQKINSLSEPKNIKSELEQKILIAEEHIRLVYVAITRAKRYLYMTSHSSKLTFNKDTTFSFKPVTPSSILKHLISVYNNSQNSRQYINSDSQTLILPDVH